MMMTVMMITMMIVMMIVMTVMITIPITLMITKTINVSFPDFTHVFITPAIVFPMVYSIFGCLQWCDGMIRKRAASMCLKLVPLLIGE